MSFPVSEKKNKEILPLWSLYMTFECCISADRPLTDDVVTN